jgi:hypothetical protein
MSTPFENIAANPERYAVYASEVMLSDFDNETVTFWLDGDYDKNPFSMGKRAIDHPDHGTRYLVFAVEIDDHDIPVDIDMRQRFIDATGEIFKPVTQIDKVVQKAALLCKDRDFQRFVYSQIKHFTDEQKSAFILSGIPAHLTARRLDSMKEPEHAEQWCKYYLYYRCDVSSRRQLGFYVKAREAFAQVQTDFNNWGRSGAKIPP